ncbi:transcriptional regulatory protein LEU3 [Microdochium nivale]|nr:transcriptional regulatory protein LEU3 [Microdochium nivale]
MPASANKRKRMDENTPQSFRRHDKVDSHAFVSGTPASAKPQLTRACAECKKHKVKCFVQPDSRFCNRCIKAGIECVPHNLAQRFIDEDSIWKAHATANINQLKAAVEHLLQHNKLPNLPQYSSIDTAQTSSTPLSNDEDRITSSGAVVMQVVDGSHGPNSTKNGGEDTQAKASSRSSSNGPHGNFIPEGPSADLQQDDDSELVPLPMNNLYSLTDPGSSRLMHVDPASVNGPDFISRGVVTLAEAELLFEHFRCRINPLLWDGILCSHRNLQAARKSSSLLVATVLTVAALHMPNREQSLRATYDAFVSLMRASCLLRSRNLDDIRGLCIGAFYLTSLSWALCSRAVRVGTEMNLHKSSLQFARGSLESYERVRLWYVLYVCDHQFALAYGRPPMMHDDASIRNADKLLSSGLSSPGDRGLVAQVKLFQILADSYFMYGCDPDLELTADDFERLQSFNISLDQWRLQHQQKATPSYSINYLCLDSGGPSVLLPSKTTTLYYHLARFQLNSVALRGISARRAAQSSVQSTSSAHQHSDHNGISLQQDLFPAWASSGGADMSWDRQEAANNAISAATSTIRLVADDADIQKAFIGMPIFIHAMIAVCASFLVKLSVAFGEPRDNKQNTNNRSNTGSGTGAAVARDSMLLLHLPRDLTQYGLNLHTKTVLADVESLVRVLGPVADNGSQQHVACHVVTGLRELLQRISPAQGTGPGGTGDDYMFSSKSPVAALPQEKSLANASGDRDPTRGTALGSFAVATPSKESRGSSQAGVMNINREVGSNLDCTRSYGYEGAETVYDSFGNSDMAIQQQGQQESMGMMGASVIKDPFDLMGDLDWRFNDAFLWNITNDAPYM